MTAPLWRQYSEHDNCTFGPVSNAEYRALLADAKAKRRVRWLPFDDSDKIISAELSAELIEMGRAEPSLYRRVAMVHAVARAHGAHYLNVNQGRAWTPYESALISFNYEVDISRFIRLQRYPRQVWINATIWNPAGTQPNRSRDDDGLSISAYALWIFDRPGNSVLTDLNEACPPIPSAELAARYEARHKRP